LIEKETWQKQYDNKADNVNILKLNSNFFTRLYTGQKSQRNLVPPILLRCYVLDKSHYDIIYKLHTMNFVWYGVVELCADSGCGCGDISGDQTRTDDIVDKGRPTVRGSIIIRKSLLTPNMETSCDGLATCVSDHHDIFDGTPLDSYDYQPLDSDGQQHRQSR